MDVLPAIAPPGATPVIAALTDYGWGVYLAQLRAAACFPAAPGAHWLDLDHAVPAGDVSVGALTLRRAVRALPRCVVVAVVDPGVGSSRRGVAIETASGHLMVGPDNGLLEPAARRLGGVRRLVDLAASPLRRPSPAPTFDGRDLFGPVAGALAAGASLAEVGEPGDARSLVGMAVPHPRRDGDRVEAAVLEIDAFGTLVLALDEQLGALGDLSPLGTPIDVRLLGDDAGDEVRSATRGRTFADVDPGALVLLPDSDGALSLAVRDGSAAALLGAHRGDILVLGPVPEGDVA